MFGNVTALEGSHVTGKYRNKSMQHTCAFEPGEVGGDVLASLLVKKSWRGRLHVSLAQDRLGETCARLS